MLTVPAGPMTALTMTARATAARAMTALTMAAGATA